MLTQFTVENFKSIKDAVTLDMQAASLSEHEDRVIHSKNGDLILPITAIYGPNGGGKSNILEAIWALSNKVVLPLILATHADADKYPVLSTPIEPFAFLPEKAQSSTKFSLYYQTDIAEYHYQLEVFKDKILSESLDRMKFSTNRKSELFERQGNDILLKGDLKKLKVSKDISSHLPLLSYLAITYANEDVIKDAMGWFRNKISVYNYGNPYRELAFPLTKSEEIRELLLQMMKEMDLDIVDYRIDEIAGNRMEIYTKHKVLGVDTELNLKQESSGTIKIFSLLPIVSDAILQGKTLIIDELDAKLHPVLLKYLINLFNDLNINRNHAQLIFTSHDLSTMNNETFRRDEIYFVAKGIEQNSCMYSLSDFKTDAKRVRKDANFGKQYLEGKYGADPYLRKIIDWEVVSHDKT